MGPSLAQICVLGRTALSSLVEYNPVFESNAPSLGSEITFVICSSVPVLLARFGERESLMPVISCCRYWAMMVCRQHMWLQTAVSVISQIAKK